MDGSAVDVGHLHGDVIGLLSILGSHRTHGADHGTLEGTGLDGLDADLVHGNVAALGNVADLDALAHQSLLEGEGAADQEADIALLPVLGNVGQGLTVPNAVAIDAVAGDIGADVAALAHVIGQGLLALDDLQNGAGEGIQLGKLLKISGVLRGQDDQVGLGIAAAHTGGGEVDDALADQLTDLSGFHVDIRGNIKCHFIFLLAVCMGMRRFRPPERCGWSSGRRAESAERPERT